MRNKKHSRSCVVEEFYKKAYEYSKNDLINEMNSHKFLQNEIRILREDNLNLIEKLDSMNEQYSATSKQLYHYLRQIGEFKELPWYKKLTYNFKRFKNEEN